MIILGVSGAFGHDAAAALVVDGHVVAACEEERFNRIKRSPKHPAVLAVQHCLAQAGVALEEVDVLALGWDPSLMLSDLRLTANYDAFINDYRLAGFRPPVTHFVPHHAAHAASSWYTAGLDEAAVLVADGQGEVASITIYSASGSGLSERLSYSVPASLGFFYAAITRYLGFGPGSAGKVMGLAAYGEPSYSFPELDFSPSGDGITIPGEQTKFARFAWWLSRLEEIFGVPGRPKSSQLPPVRLRNAAASAQAALERSLGQLARLAVNTTGNRSLVLSGGVALNCSANGRLRASKEFGDVFVFGAAHDAGTALGAALHVAAQHGEPLSQKRATSAFLGADHEIGIAVDLARRLGLHVWQAPNLHDVAARLLNAGKIGGWYQGRSEFGPRALGGRSIIARADRTDIRDRVNRIKHRELWRPMSPALTDSGVRRLGLTGSFDYMIEACWPDGDARSLRKSVAGALHVDGSMRPLVVSDSAHPFHRLLAAAESIFGADAIINTSFNTAREPMVETPEDALRTFVSTDLDFLALGDALVQKPQ